MATIDLGGFRTEGTKIFSGRDRGKQVRKALRLDRIDKSEEPVVVIVPDDVYSVNSSFFLGMFTPSIKELGERGFRKKYRFEGKDISRVVDEGIRVTLTTASPFLPIER